MSVSIDFDMNINDRDMYHVLISTMMLKQSIDQSITDSSIAIDLTFKVIDEREISTGNRSTASQYHCYSGSHCIDVKDLGNVYVIIDKHTIHETALEEIVRQSMIFDFDPTLYIKYAGDFVSNCLIPYQTLNMTDCSLLISITESYAISTDIVGSLLNHDARAIESVLASQAMQLNDKCYRKDDPGCVENRRGSVVINGLKIAVL